MKNYLGIRLWHEQTGSMQYYIDDLIEAAQGGNAPEDAIYRDSDGLWVYVADLAPHHPFRAQYEELRRQSNVD